MMKIGIWIFLWRLWATYTLWEIATNVKVVIDNQHIITENQRKILVDGEQ